MAQHVDEAGGFADECPLGKDRVARVNLKLHLVAHALTGEQADVAQRVQFFFQVPGAACVWRASSRRCIF